MRSTVSRCPIQKLEDSTYNFKKTRTEMNYNCIYFHLKKLQLGPIDGFPKASICAKEQCTCYFFLLFLTLKGPLQGAQLKLEKTQDQLTFR